MNASPGDRWPRVAVVALLGICTLASVLHPRLYPHFTDVYYHIAAIEGFRQAGGLPLWAFWEQAEAGRPHIYPPALHLAGMLSAGLGVSPWTFGVFMSWACWPVSLWLAWLLVRRIGGERAGLLAVAFLAGPHAWFFQQAAHTANAWALLWTIGALLAFSHNRMPLAGACAALAAGSHGMGFAAPVALGLARLIGPKGKTCDIFWLVGLPLAAFAPWAWHMAQHQGQVASREGWLQWGMFRLDPVLTVFALAGLGVSIGRAMQCRRQDDNESAQRWLLGAAFLAGFTVVFPMHYAHRFWAFNAFLPYALLAGIGGAAVLERMRGGVSREAATIALTLSALLVMPVWRPASRGLPEQAGNLRRLTADDERAPEWLWEKPALWTLAIGRTRGMERWGYLRELGKWLHTARGELRPGCIVFAPGVIGNVATAATGVWSTGGMLAEVEGNGRPTAAMQCDYILDMHLARKSGPPLHTIPFPPAPKGFEVVEEHAARAENQDTLEARLYRSTKMNGPRPAPRAAVPSWVFWLGVGGFPLLVLAEKCRRSTPGLRANGGCGLVCHSMGLACRGRID